MRNPENVVCHEHPRHIELVWPDGTRRSFLYVWLRDNCPTGRHSNGQKSKETSSIPRDITAEGVSINELGVLEIKWAGEDHVSYFDVEVLRRKSEPAKKWTSIIDEEKVLWDASLDLEPATISFHDYLFDEAKLYAFLSSFIRVGFGIIKDSPTEHEVLPDVVGKFGYIRETNYGKLFSVKVKADPENLADTAMALSPHTDNPYRDPVPTLQLLHCLENSMEGGETVLVDGFRLHSSCTIRHW